MAQNLNALLWKVVDKDILFFHLQSITSCFYEKTNDFGVRGNGSRERVNELCGQWQQSSSFPHKKE